MEKIMFPEIKKKFLEKGLVVESIKKLKVGTSRNSYLITTKDKKYILKLYDKGKLKEIQRKINYLRKINAKKEITVNPINSKVMEFGKFVGYFYGFFEGIHYRYAKLSRKFFKFGEIVGEFSKQTKNIIPVTKSNSREKRKIKESLKIIKFFEEKNDKKVVELMKQGLLYLKNLDKYRSQLIHGDLHFDNVLYNEKTKEFRIIDVDGIGRGVVPREVLVMPSYAIDKSVSENKKIIKEMMKGYEFKFKLTRKEKKAIPVLMILRKNDEITWLVKQFLGKKINEKEFNRFLGGSIKQLKIIIDQFDILERLF